MTDSRLNQMHFDVSEKVRLHPQQPGIKTLLELDLYPDVEIKDEGKHLKIQGYLRLNGTYAPEDGEGVQTQGDLREELAYVIPVEITLPTERAKLENVVAEVEAFDYNVLSPFELQVEAILSIGGLISETKEQQVTMQEEESLSFAASPAALEEEVLKAEVAPMDTVDEVERQEEEASAEVDERVYDVREDVSAPEVLTKPEEEPTKSTHPLHFLNDFWTKKRETQKDPLSQSKEIESFAMEKELSQEDLEKKYSCSEDSDEKSDHAEWISYLMGNREETFTSMRMVIAQREDTIDTLSDKYGISSSRLMSLNHLETGELEEGQIVYVPKKMQRTS